MTAVTSSYVSWPEEAVPADCANCQRCGLYKQGTRMVWGEGNPAAPILLVLDNPGAREDREGTPFVCGTRQTLQEAAIEVGLSTQDLYATYVLKYRPIRAYDKEAARATCMQHLERQLVEKKPRLVLCLGNVAVQSFFGDPGAEVKLLRGQWHDIRGVRTTAAYHPLAVRRRPNLWRPFLEDWQTLAAAWKEIGEASR